MLERRSFLTKLGLGLGAIAAAPLKLLAGSKRPASFNDIVRLGAYELEPTEFELTGNVRIVPGENVKLTPIEGGMIRIEAEPPLTSMAFREPVYDEYNDAFDQTLFDGSNKMPATRDDWYNLIRKQLLKQRQVTESRFRWIEALWADAEQVAPRVLRMPLEWQKRWYAREKEENPAFYHCVQEELLYQHEVARGMYDGYGPRGPRGPFGPYRNTTMDALHAELMIRYYFNMPVPTALHQFHFEAAAFWSFVADAFKDQINFPKSYEEDRKAEILSARSMAESMIREAGGKTMRVQMLWSRNIPTVEPLYLYHVEKSDKNTPFITINLGV